VDLKGRFPLLRFIQHPLVQHKLTLIRSHDTGKEMFRHMMAEIGLLMGYEMTRDLKVSSQIVTTPLGEYTGSCVSENKIVVIPVLRAGLGMADGILKLIPEASVGHIGCYRDHETKRPVEYLVSLPPTKDREMIVVDPMLATGFSAAHAVSVLKNKNVHGKNIRFMALVAAPEGLEAFFNIHPDVIVYVVAVDSYLDENAYIFPGLGDAGDRLFGT
jgi:uracil phosphoribosyltransferase|tara:strand:+ start:42 stop:689 length:648 start_codon:yes stop_codon:yes gene_type:complete